jgi:DNA polymerase theta
VIASGVATTRAHVAKYASCTLLAHSIEADRGGSQVEADAQHNCVRGCVEFLEEHEFIRYAFPKEPSQVVLRNCRSFTRLQERADGGDTSYIATQLGLACLASSLSPDEGLHVFQELQTARKCFVLENELHIVYQASHQDANLAGKSY